MSTWLRCDGVCGRREIHGEAYRVIRLNALAIEGYQVAPLSGLPVAADWPEIDLCGDCWRGGWARARAARKAASEPPAPQPGLDWPQG